MDTSPSSASSSTSSSGSESGEEEVVGTVTRAHQETFMYNQEQEEEESTPPTARQAQPSPGPGVAEHMGVAIAESNQAWNQRNDITSMMSTGPRSQNPLPAHPLHPHPQSPGGNARFHDARDGSPSGGCPAFMRGHAHRAYGHVSVPTEHGEFGGGSRMHLVCPMNISPHVDPRMSGQEVWEEFSLSFTPAVREVVEFAKRIPGFRDLSQHDQVSLLKAGTFEVLVVRFASLFDAKDRTVTFLNGRKYSVEALRSMGAGDLLNSMFDFSQKLIALGLSEEEMGLFTAVVLVSADRSGIENVNSVEALQETLIRALRSLIMKNHPNEAAIFTKLLLKLPDLRSLNNMHSEELLAFRVHP
ncbi:hypothetical protein AGOR_G00045060 [Albula goreensis]|uniref:NR LBD domain-containing protein n=1 Tax=Albula goreensis TaxID=1534307 RepID=A0A8T3E2I9_9TELE|nr:hypothetical protein AGOR_G00045060 [Albula goreensis]